MSERRVTRVTNLKGREAFEAPAMVRFGFIAGLILPAVLLVVNLASGYGGILATIALLVWIGLGILIVPEAEET